MFDHLYHLIEMPTALTVAKAVVVAAPVGAVFALGMTGGIPAPTAETIDIAFKTVIVAWIGRQSWMSKREKIAAGMPLEDPPTGEGSPRFGTLVSTVAAIKEGLEQHYIDMAEFRTATDIHIKDLQRRMERVESRQTGEIRRQ